MKILIIGGVAGGASAAARLRRLSETDEIIMFEKDEYISFANCGLPYYIGGVIENRDKLLVQTVDGMKQRFAIDVRNNQEVVAINREQKTVTVLNHKNKDVYVESYDRLILSPGASPIWPNLDGLVDAKNVFKLRNIPDTDAIKELLSHHPRKAVVVGGGFIGIEMAENLRHLGIKVTLVDIAEQLLMPFDTEMAAILHNEVSRHEVILKLGVGLSGFKENGKIVLLSNGETLESDLTILAIGVSPTSLLAKQAGLTTGLRDAVIVNEQLQTNDPNIYAIGDVIQVNHFVSKKPTYIPLAWPANRQGRLVADHINHIDIDYPGTLGSSVAKVFDMVAASTGLNERVAQQLGYPVATTIIHRANHAGYYPESSNLTMKLVYNKETQEILGGQAIGYEGTEKRIDVLATAIIGKLKVKDLCALELCYAPPFSSAKDPINILGYAASHIIDGLYQSISFQELNERNCNSILLDVRTPLEYQTGHIEGAMNIELDQLREQLNSLPQNKDAMIVVYCRVGQRAHYALNILRHLGYTNLFNLSGGYLTYEELERSKHLEGKQDSCIEIENDTQVPELDMNSIKIDEHINACGLQCPGPILETFKALEHAPDGKVIEVSTSDYGYANDIQQWCKKTGNKLLKLESGKGKVTALIQKGSISCSPLQSNKQKSTIVLFSGELDKALAAMIIASGSASLGQEVTIFFTFWGLNVLRKTRVDVPVSKSGMEKMFSFMMPKGASRLGLSKMNFGGLGKKMMTKIMKNKNVDDIDTLIKTAQDLGVKFIACTMSMDVMGLKEEELMDGIEYGGVASYVSDSADAGLTLFI